MRRGLLRRLAFSLLPLVVVLGSAELGLRAAGWPPQPTSFDHRSVYWVLEPGQRQAVTPHPEESRSFHMSTDSRGLRAPLHEGPKPAGVTRVLAMGCSTTLGWGVEDGESYPARLEELAVAAGKTSVQVLNGGQPGYTSFQGLWLWDTALKDTQPDVVLLGYVVQDARKAAYTDRSQAVLSRDNRYLKEHVLYQSRVYLGLRALLGTVQIRAKERPSGSGPDDAHGVYRVPPEEYRENLRALVERVRAVGAQPVLFGYPLEVEGYTAEHRRVAAEVAEQTGARRLDLQGAMTAEAAAQTLYFERDRGHANAAGNALIAQWVYDWLSGEGLLAGG